MSARGNKCMQERIRTIIDGTRMSDAAFARSLGGYSRASMSQILKGNRPAPDSLLHAISDTYGISYTWLLTGDGMMRTDEAIAPEVLPEDGGGMQIVEAEEDGLPLIPVDAMAGALGEDARSIMPYDCERFVIPAFRSADFLIRVQGDSMQPHYLPGDIVACKRVPLDRLWFQWGKTYVIDTSQGALIKRIEQSPKDGCVQLQSDNTKYNPIDLPTSEINGVALICGIIRVE